MQKNYIGFIPYEGKEVFGTVFYSPFRFYEFTKIEDYTTDQQSCKDESFDAIKYGFFFKGIFMADELGHSGGGSFEHSYYFPGDDWCMLVEDGDDIQEKINEAQNINPDILNKRHEIRHKYMMGANINPKVDDV